MSIEPLGDSALIVRVVDDFARDPEASLDAVQAALRSLETAAIPGVTDLAPAYSTIGVFFTVVATARAAGGEGALSWLSARIESALQTRTARDRQEIAKPVIENSVCYDSRLDLHVVVVAGG